MLKLDIKPGESVKIGENVIITLESKSGNVARIAIKAPKDVPITRAERANPAKMAAEMGLQAA